MMLGEDELAEIEGDAARVLRLTNDGEAPPVLSVCLALTGRAPLERPGLRGEGVLEDGQVRSDSFCGSVKSRPRCFLGIFAEYARTT